VVTPTGSHITPANRSFGRSNTWPTISSNGVASDVLRRVQHTTCTRCSAADARAGRFRTLPSTPSPPRHIHGTTTHRPHRPPGTRRYIRVKRKATTVFLNVEKSDSFRGIKAKLAEMLGANAEKIHLFTSRDESTETVDTAFVDNFCESDVVVRGGVRVSGSAARRWRRERTRPPLHGCASRAYVEHRDRAGLHEVRRRQGY